MRRTWSAVLLLSFALAACGSPVAWGADLVLERREAQSAEDSAAVRGAQGGIVVDGVYRAPSTGFALRAYYDVSGGDVTVYVSGYPPEGGTLPAVTGLGYHITFGLPAGTYDVTVRHEDQDAGNPAPRDVATAEVTVGHN